VVNEHGNCYFVECDEVVFDSNVPTFRRSILPLSSWPNWYTPNKLRVTSKPCSEKQAACSSKLSVKFNRTAWGEFPEGSSFGRVGGVDLSSKRGAWPYLGTPLRLTALNSGLVCNASSRNEEN
jgi:hypothetical protein